MKFLYKYNNPKNGLRKTLNKNLPIKKRFIQRYVLFYTGINPHLPYGIEWDLEIAYKDKLTREQISELGKILAKIAYNFCEKNNLLGGYFYDSRI